MASAIVVSSQSGGPSGGGGALSSNEEALSYTFQFDAHRRWIAQEDRETRELLAKWGVDPAQGHFSFQQFQFDNVFSRANLHEFLIALFNSETFRSTFRLGDGRGNYGGFWGPARVTAVDFTALNTTATSLDIFDPLINNQVVRKESLRICPMRDEYLPGGVTVADRLRGLFMIGEDSMDQPEDVDLVPAHDRKELLWHTMWRVLAGGALNQWDDDFNTYKNVCRDLYKDMVSVAKDPSTGELSVQSVAVQVHAAKGSDMDVALFPKDDGPRQNHNFMYVIVQPARRSVVVWYNAFWSPF